MRRFAKHFLSRHLAPLLAAFALLSSTPSVAADSGDDLLEPEKAFVFSARESAPGEIEARFQIAEGYYLYGGKLKFSAEDGVALSAPLLPPGKIKQDEYFGRVETHRGDLRIRLPYTRDAAPARFVLKADFQGCADAGVCYPPQTASVTIQRAAAAPAQAATPAAVPAPAAVQTQDPSVLARLQSLTDGLGSSGEDDFLSVEEAFKTSLVAVQGGGLELRFSIAPGHYLYRDKIKVAALAPDGVKTALRLPPAEAKDDPTFGRTFVYHDSFSVGVSLEGLAKDASTLKALVSYQGCSDKGICYPPQEVELTADLSKPVPGQPVAGTPAPAASAGADDGTETGRIAQILKGGNFWVIIASFFGFGLLLSLTPCVFPMIPILSGIIVGRSEALTKTRGFILSLAYVLGMALTYALIGVIAGLSGTLISNTLQNPWALGAGAAIFVALALSMFGFYELQMPSFLQSRLAEASNKVQGGNLTGVFIMGALSALIVGPCVAAPLAGALLYISQTGDVLLGGVSLFSLAMGMGVPLLLVGISAGALLPRAGGWMESVKQFFGVALLGVAIWLISPLMDAVWSMLLWAALLIVSAVYMHALDPLPPQAKGMARFWKGVGVVALMAGIALLLGALAGGRDVLQPLKVFQGGASDGALAAEHLAFKRVKSVAELDAAVSAAAASGKPVMLDFYADWCVSCKEMERLTFSDPRVRARLKDVTLLQVDVTANSADDKSLLKRFKLFGPPGILFFDATGREQAFRVVGYENADAFLNSLEKGLR